MAPGVQVPIPVLDSSDPIVIGHPVTVR